MKKITIITGHYGTGKTNISVNLALELASQNNKVTVVDLDIVNPYFRTADFDDLFASKGVSLIKPMYANSNLDIPAVNFDLEELALGDGYLIVDVGGDDAGAIALGRYAQALEKFRDDMDMFYVVNCYRYLTRKPEEALELMYEIEAAARLRHTGIINNSNLGYETTAKDVAASEKFAAAISEKAQLPLIFTACPRKENSDNKFKNVDIYVKPIWEA
ncbi:MAG: P-loop NTPase [Oscillospiraceae bacterium]|nr:P-loop NTPase [Oscillospiraceae bacterium]